MSEAVGLAIRSISSHVAQPTSPIQISLVPGLKVNRKGFRKPAAMIRFALASELLARGLSANAAPVLGSMRTIDPFSTTGSPAARRTLWLRNAPPSAVGGV